MNTPEQGQVAQTPQHAPIQQTVIVMGQQNKKSAAVAFILSFFFGPLGLLYASVTGGIVMLVIAIPVAIFSFGIGLILINIICVIWALVAVGQHNNKVGQPQPLQHFQQPAPPSRVE